MWRPSLLHISFALLLTLSLFISCRKDEPTDPSEQTIVQNDTIIIQTDSTEWHVRLFETGKLYNEAVQVQMPDPWRLPTREDAQILKTIEYPSEERFITSDGYTFGMPSASVIKAGSKTKYSVLGLYIRKSTIIIEF